MATVFVVGMRADLAADPIAGCSALDGWLRDYPQFAGEPVETWVSPSHRLVAHWTSHPRTQTGGVRYVEARSDRLALFTGRPFIWRDEHVADGTTCLDPSFYLSEPSKWIPMMDGASIALRIVDDVLTLYSDPHGMNPIFTARSGGTSWVSNDPAVLYRIVGKGDVRLDVLAMFLSVGYGLSGQPLWEGVDRVERGRVLTGGTGGLQSTPIDPGLASLFGRGADMDAAAKILVAATGALGDWPGRPCYVPVTGGRDSRLVVAAAVSANLDFEATTVAFPHVVGYPRTPDVVIGGRLCEALGRSHRVVEPVEAVYDDPATMVELLARRSPGTHSLSDATTLTTEVVTEALPIVMVGTGGEFARGRYGHGRDLDQTTLPGALFERIIKGRTTLIGTAGKELVLAWLQEFTTRQLEDGVAPEDVPDCLFLNRVSTWAATTALATSCREDSVKPLMSRRLLPHQLGLSFDERKQEVFHLEVLRRIAPELVRVPFEGTKPYWPAMRSPTRRKIDRAAVRLRRASTELRRRRLKGPDRFETVFRYAADVIRSQPEHPAWEVVSRGRVEALLDAELADLDGHARNQLWRLATVFGQSAPAATVRGDPRADREACGHSPAG